MTATETTDSLKQTGPVPESATRVDFECNICGGQNVALLYQLQREGGACSACGSVVRFRSLIAALSERLFGCQQPLREFPVRRDVVGLGMSDAFCYAKPLAKKFSYVNTFFHTEPQFDITRPDSQWVGRCDFVVTSDVFEHVAPPVQRAFDNLFQLLRPGGVLIFSVPYSLEPDTLEHFPLLHDFQVTQQPDGVWRLDNTTATGAREAFTNLVFHGGPGTTLEMRVFSLAAVRRHLQRAGFEDVQVHDATNLKHGIHWPEPWGVTLSARRPLAAAAER